MEEPFVRLLLLPTVAEDLPEHAIFVSQAVTHCGQLHCRHRVEEAGRQAPESAVAQTGVGFLLEEPGPVESLLGGRLLHDRIELQIRPSDGERAANEELHREVVDAFWIHARICVLGVYPSL